MINLPAYQERLYDTAYNIGWLSLDHLQPDLICSETYYFLFYLSGLKSLPYPVEIESSPWKCNNKSHSN